GCVGNAKIEIGKWKFQNGKGKVGDARSGDKRMSGRIVEISVDRIVRAEAAERGGASRIELGDSLEIGGVTPALGAMWAVRYCLDGPVFAMVRPRGGDFVYTAKEFEEMRVSIDRARLAGMNGIVLGLLRGDGGVDVERTAELVREAAPLPVTFH